MRVISGRYGGRRLATPKSRGTRPMTDKVRAALFDILGPLDNYEVLDAYAGSGALGFEALSRGAIRVDAIEVGAEAATAIRQNIAALGVQFQYQLEKMSVEHWLARPDHAHYDLIFAMPPYAALDTDTLQRLGDLLTEPGIMVVEYPRQHGDITIEGLEIIATRSYGDPTLAFYRTSRR